MPTMEFCWPYFLQFIYEVFTVGGGEGGDMHVGFTYININIWT